jgi:putative transposase
MSRARPVHPLPEPITNSNKITHLHIRQPDRLGGIIHEFKQGG